MQFSLLLLLGIPVALLLGVFVAVATRVLRALWRRQIPSGPAVLGLLVGLVLIDGVLSLLVVLNAALSHSERTKHYSTSYCLAIFILVVVVPAAAIGLRLQSIRAGRVVSPPLC